MGLNGHPSRVASEPRMQVLPLGRGRSSKYTTGAQLLHAHPLYSGGQALVQVQPDARLPTGSR